MNNFEADAPPPFLHGVYVKDDFDFTQCGSALQRNHPSPQPAAPDPDPPAEPELSAMMSDEDFLNSLLTPVEHQQAEAPLGEQDDSGDAEPDENSHENDEAEDSQVHYLLSPKDQALPRRKRFPFKFSWIEKLDLKFPNAVTFFVGENGSGKSTLLEAIAGLSGFPVWGGGRNDLADQFGPEKESELAQALYPHFRKRPRDGYFFRAEYYAQFASLLDARGRDEGFEGDPYMRYGGKSLHTRSHGESFFELMDHRMTRGLYLLDEPESALSPKRQLALMALILDRSRKGKTQFIIATHSPILMTFPGATIVNFDSPDLETMDYQESDHFQLTKGILDHPARYWKHLES